MFDPQFRLSPNQLDGNAASDDSLSNGLWPQMSFDHLLEHHDIAPAKSLSVNDASNNDFWSSSAQFKEFFNNYNRQYQQQNQPVDISSLLSSSPPQQHHHHHHQQQQQQQQQQQHFPLPIVDNHIFEPQSDPQPLFLGQYLPDNNQMSIRRDSLRPHHHQQQQQQPPQPSQPYLNRSRQMANIQRQHQQQQHHRTPPLLQIPNEEHYQQQQQQQQYQQHVIGPSRFKQTQVPAYVACLNHGINYNGVSGPPILLPPSF